MKTLKSTVIRLCLLLGIFTISAFLPLPEIKTTSKGSFTTEKSYHNTYHQLQLGALGLPKKAFDMAVNGWEKLMQNGTISKSVVAICDFTQSSTQKRLYIVDLEAGKVLLNTWVAHGKNTGEEFARSFSNKPSSLQSSLGFYAATETYTGEHGLSLKLKGLEKGFNDKAEERSIVLHGASYVCDSFIDREGRLGRSWGCPAVSYDEHEFVINTLKDGGCLFIYYPDKSYLTGSRLIRKQ
ncbi:MAG: murein L,D-transpeptidase catalytic domain family protein [Chitinophagales bacterium]|nr:murein L,D-transpeptidase catalytic domain family protein [Chitinophagales bacterium]